MGPKLPTAVLIAVLSLLAINGCYSQEELEPDLAMAMVDEEGNMWWDPTAKTSIQTHDGDMAILKTGSGGKEKRAAIRHRSRQWPDGIIPFSNLYGIGLFVGPVGGPDYQVEYRAFERAIILEAMKHWEEKTCLRFVPRTDETDYIFFFRGRGCYSYVGRTGGGQGISLRANCVTRGTVLHELGHSIGFYHEQNRPDRDNYVAIPNTHYHNNSINYRKLTEEEIDSLGVGYDYNSIMHYDYITALDPEIITGQAEELSPLDILQTNKLYQCDQIGNRSSQIVVPPTPPLVVPDIDINYRPNASINCGGILTGMNGSFASPGFPSLTHNQDCAWVIGVPEGYRVAITVETLLVDISDECSRHFIQVFEYGRNVTESGTQIGSINCPRENFRNVNGRYCKRMDNCKLFAFRSLRNEVIVYYHTDGNSTEGSLQGLQASFEAEDLNECRFSNCHTCVNTPGSFQCSCNDGYYYSPAARKCFDVNECAIENGGCEHTCVNRAGSYRCECDQGFTLQEDGTSCGCGGRLTTASGSLHSPNWPETYNVDEECEWTIELTDPTGIIRITFDSQEFGIAGEKPECSKDVLEIFDGLSTTADRFRYICGTNVPDTIVTSSNAAKIVFTAGPDRGEGRKGFKIDYQAASCGGRLTTASGSLQSPNWPETYNVDEVCEWTIELPDPNSTVRITFDSQEFGIAGYTPDCLKDVLEIFDGLDSSADKFKDICGVILPDPITTSSNAARIVFTAGQEHGSGRKGFKLDYQLPIVPPTTQPPTTRPTTATTQPPTQAGCGGRLTTASGSLQSPNWPETYNVDEECEWTIELPNDTSVIAITFDIHDFGIAGYTPDCLKDVLEIFDGLGTNAARFDAMCGTILPNPITTSSNVAKIVFTAGPAHGPLRKGFKLNYAAISTATTQPPTTRPTTATTQPPTQAGCGGRLTTASGSLQSPNWPETYNVDEVCDWTIELPNDTSVITITFDSQEFGIAGYTPDCLKDVLEIFDGFGTNAARFDAICGTILPDHITTSSNAARIVFTAGPEHGPLRKGFKLDYTSRLIA